MTTENVETKNAIAFFKKKNELRKAICQADLTPDKMMSVGGGFKYLSVGKMKSIFAPILAKVGLEPIMNFTSVKEDTYWLTTFTVQYADVDTGYIGPIETFQGSASDAGGKGQQISVSFALKNMLSTTGLLADGMDVDALESPGGHAYSIKEEKEEVKSKTRAKVEEPKPAPKEEPVQVPKEEPKPEPKTSAPKVAPAPKEEPEKKPEAPVEPAPAKFEMSVPHRGAIDKIFKGLKALAEGGKMTAEDYNKISMECAEIDSNTKAKDFVMKYIKYAQ